MDKKDRLEYLSSISGIEKTLLETYRKDNEKKMQELARKYQKEYEEKYETFLKHLKKPYQELRENLEQERVKGMEAFLKTLQPSLPNTLTSISAQFGSKESLQDAIKSLKSTVSQTALQTDQTTLPLKIAKDLEEEDFQKELPKPTKIKKIKLNNFRFFYSEHCFDLEHGKSLFLYGENGSGKSSLYKAFEFLIQESIDSELFESQCNIYDKKDSFIEFVFDNDEELKIDQDNLELGSDYSYVKSLTIFKPLLDYKDLLKIYYAKNSDEDTHNLFSLFQELLKDYPIESGKRLGDLSGDDYFSKLTEIINELHKEINSILDRFGFNLNIENIQTDAHDSKITLSLESHEERIVNHNDFLNEAKLTALAISIFFAIIVKIYTLMPDKSLKILVLDDLLLSLNMSNRDKVLEILLDENLFEDFQFFIFTHDKAFFEMAKRKFDYMQRGKWKYFEMYIDRNENKEFPYIKKYDETYGDIEQAKEHFKNKDYPACANYLRKEVEKLFDKYLKLDKLDEKINLAKLKENFHIVKDISKELKKLVNILQQFEHCEKIPQEKQPQKCQEFAKQVIKSIEKTTEYIDNKIHFEEFEDVKLILKNILHPQSHSDATKPLYKKELEDAIKIIEEFNSILEDTV